MTAGTWLLLTLTCLVGLSFVPWTINLAFKRAGARRFSGSLVWAGIPLRSFQGPRRQATRVEAPTSSRHAPLSWYKRSGSSNRRALSAIRSRGFVPALLKHAYALCQACSFWCSQAS